MKINNLPSKLKKYVVARGYKGEYWFWGTWDDEWEAYNVAEDVNGQVFLTMNIKEGVPA